MARLRQTVNKIGRALDATADRRREAARERLSRWVRLRDPTKRDAVWQLLWRSGETESPGDKLPALRSLAKIEELLDRSKAELAQRIQPTLESYEATLIDPELLERAREGLRRSCGRRSPPGKPASCACDMAFPMAMFIPYKKLERKWGLRESASGRSKPRL